ETGREPESPPSLAGPGPSRQAEGDPRAEHRAVERADDRARQGAQASLAEQAGERVEPDLRAGKRTGHQIEPGADETAPRNREQDTGGGGGQGGDGRDPPRGRAARGGHPALRQPAGGERVAGADGSADDEPFGCSRERVES